MKPVTKIFSFLYFVIFLFPSWGGYKGAAQTNVYHQFPDSNAIWLIHINDPNNFPTAWSYYHILDGDTFINSMKYSKLITIPADSWGYVGGDPRLVGIREDTLNRKVFAWLKVLNVDTLLYDFGLNVGDTFNSYMVHPDCYPVTISAIDSILIGTQYRKMFLLDHSCQFLSAGNCCCIIEGIGYCWGLLEMLANNFEVLMEIYCFLQNGNSLYPSPGCSTLVGLNDNKITVHSSLFIASQEVNNGTILRVSQSETNFSTIAIFNIAGMWLNEFVLYNTHEILLNKNKFLPGIYFYLLKDKENNNMRGKFIIY